MPHSIVITQCLQNDFIRPIEKYDALPNLLHIGFDEARRLSGEAPADGPIMKVMGWAYQQKKSRLKIIHIRDWHDSQDVLQMSHLGQFGMHCLKNTWGAQFVFEEPAASENAAIVINSNTLNDFIDTDLPQILAAEVQADTRIGVMGVWTEAKVYFLCYELRSRFPDCEIAVCSALTASSSRNSHFYSLDQISKLFGVIVISSVGEFIEYLGGESRDPKLLDSNHRQSCITLDGQLDVNAEELELIKYLFRDCSNVKLKELAGGFSGNLVLGSESIDLERRKQVPHVIKIGERHPIAQERMSFERVEAVFGNSAPRIVDFADFGNKGAIKYRYASMGGTFSQTFQKFYARTNSLGQIEKILKTVFVDQLGRLYRGGEKEKVDLLDYYGFDARWAKGIRKRVAGLIEMPEDYADFRFPGDVRAPNLCKFYEETLAVLPRHPGKSWYFSYIHGDLNGANIIIDDNKNVWLIDFFHTHRGHILKDLIKLENDILYIFTKVTDEEEFRQAVYLSNLLLAVGDIAKPLPVLDRNRVKSEAIIRAYQTINILRSFYAPLVKTDKDPLQLLIGQLRYAVHTLGFDECNIWQKRWALYTACRCTEEIERRLNGIQKLRVDWLAVPEGKNIGLTILPGRKDYHRNLKRDIEDLKKSGITHVACLLPAEELASYGVGNLLEELALSGFQVFHLPIIDQKISSQDSIKNVIAWINDALANHGRVLLHCAAGLGRSGMVAAAYLKTRGLETDTAIAAVRSARSQRAIETFEQEEFIREFH